MNELKLAAMELIDGMTAKSFKGDREKLNKIFETDFDFGEFESQLNDIRSEMFTKATDKCEKIEMESEAEKKRIAAEELNSQREKVFQWRESILSSIDRINPENLNSETKRIEKEISEFDAPLVITESNPLKEMIGDALKRKVQSVSDEIIKQNDLAEKAKQEQESKMTSRLKMIKDELDIPYDFKEQAYIGSGVYIPNLDIQTKTDDEFAKLIEDCKVHIAKFPTVPQTETDENSAAEVVDIDTDFENDRQLMKDVINKSIRMNHAPLDGLKTERGIEMWNQVTVGLGLWCDTEIESLDNII
jgi:hypothetical protein